MGSSLFGNNQPSKQNNAYNMLQNMAKMNPQVSGILNMLNNGNMSAKDLFFQQAKQMGVDPQNILNMLK